MRVTGRPLQDKVPFLENDPDSLTVTNVFPVLLSPVGGSLDQGTGPFQKANIWGVLRSNGLFICECKSDGFPFSSQLGGSVLRGSEF